MNIFDSAIIVAAVAGGITGALVALVVSLGVIRAQRHLGGTTVGAPHANSEWRTPSGTLARHEAIQCGHSHIGTEHFAIALRQYSTPALDRIWNRLAVDPEALRRRIEAAVPPSPTDRVPTHLSTTPRMGTIFAMANALAAKRKRDQVSPELLLLALAEEGDGVGAQVLASLGATSQRIREIVDGPAS